MENGEIGSIAGAAEKLAGAAEKLDDACDAPLSTDNDKFQAASQILACLRGHFVRLRFRRDCDLVDLNVIESNVLHRFARSRDEQAVPESVSSTRDLDASNVLAGFVRRGVIKWLLVRQCSNRSRAACLIQLLYRSFRFVCQCHRFVCTYRDPDHFRNRE